VYGTLTLPPLDPFQDIVIINEFININFHCQTANINTCLIVYDWKPPNFVPVFKRYLKVVVLVIDRYWILFITLFQKAHPS
jgi:hypothetical protein